MALTDSLVLAGAFLRAAGLVAADAVAEPLGRGLPLAARPFTEPARFAALVAPARTSAWPDVGWPSRIETTPQHAPSSNCRNTVLALDWSTRDGRAPGPRSVFLKQPSADLATRVFANVIGFWKIECAFARHLAHQLPIDSPAIHAVAERGSRFFILMENLRERDGLQPFVNDDFVAGMDLPLARRCVRTLARLHAGFETWAPERREAALPNALHPFLSRELQPIMRAVHHIALDRCVDASAGVFTEASAKVCREALTHWPLLLRAWYPEPLTLVHGDSHLGNFFEGPKGLGMLDFQGAHWGRGPRDVHYCLVNSMAPELLALHERDLVAEYADERSRHGAPLDAGRTWQEYRAFSIQTLITAVVSIGLGSFTDSDEAMRCMLTRSVAAFERLDFAGWLGELIGGRPPGAPARGTAP